METIEKFFAFELIAGNTVKHITLFVVSLFLTLLAAKIIQNVFRKGLRRLAQKSETKLDDIVLDTFEHPIYWIALAGGLSIALGMLVLPPALQNAVDNVTTLVVMFFIGWSASNFISAIRATYIDPIVEASESKLDDQILPIAEKTLKVTLWVFVALIAFDNIGFDVVSLLTGLGIGGLALAMAAKDTLSNLFGSVTIFADRPFAVGDVIDSHGYCGVVTEVGLRTCRMETPDRKVVTVPNALFVGDVLANLSRDGTRAYASSLGLEYGTTIEELEAAMGVLKEILGAHELVREDYAVRFGAFGDSALVIEFVCSITDVGKYLDVISELNLQIKRRFDAAGYAFAFPSMSIYKGD